MHGTSIPVIYQVYPRSFRDTNGSGMGDLKGIIEKLDYIAELGADYLWISPFLKSPQIDGGYDVSDYTEVEPRFGNNDDLHDLVMTARQRGVEVMMDLVLPHTSDQHAWFIASRKDRTNPKAAWYVWADPKPDGTAPNNWVSVFGGLPAWTWSPTRRQFYHHQFLSCQPSLNLNNPEVWNSMLEIVEWWLRFGIRAFRLDALHHAFFDEELADNTTDPDAVRRGEENPFAYTIGNHSRGRPHLEEFCQALRTLGSKYPDTFYIAEIAEKATALRAVGPTKLHATYFFEPLVLQTLDPLKVSDILSSSFKEFPPRSFAWALSNHDFARHPSRLHPDPKFYDAFVRMSTALFMLTPAPYSMYQGEELGLPAAELTYEDLIDPFDRQFWPLGQQRDTARTPFPWDAQQKNLGFSEADQTFLKVDLNHSAFAAATQREDKHSHYRYFQRLIAYKKLMSTSQGELSFTLLPHSDAPGVVRYQVRNESLTIVALFNTVPSEIDISPLAGIDDFGAARFVDAISSAVAVAGTERYVLPAYGVLVIEWTTGRS